MHIIDNTYGSYVDTFFVHDEKGILTIHREMRPAIMGISPTGRFFVYCIHPHKGSSHFIIEQDHLGVWVCKSHPKHISINFISAIGKSLENQTSI